MDYGLDKKTNTLKTFNTIFIISWLLVACFPFIWTFWGSFKVRADFFSRSDWWYAISAEIAYHQSDLEKKSALTLNDPQKVQMNGKHATNNQEIINMVLNVFKVFVFLSNP